MGPAGVGKTTVGRQLAHDLGWPFLDADRLHAPDAVERMRGGHSLTDAEREPWLRRVRDAIAEQHRSVPHLVVACSALKQHYRDVIAAGVPDLKWVYLDAPAAVLHDRLAARAGHFAGPDILAGQLADLEPPADALVVPATLPVREVIAVIRSAIAS